MIKPDAIRNGHAGAIIDRFIKEGFRIVALKQTKLSAEKAGEFYAVHKERPFYGELVDFMSSGVIVAATLRSCSKTKFAASLVVMCSKTSFKPGNCFISGESTSSKKRFSRSKIST